MLRCRAGTGLRSWAAMVALLFVSSGVFAAPSGDPVPRELIVHFAEGWQDAEAAAGGRRVRPGVSVVAVDSDGRIDHAEQWRRLHQSMERWRGRPGVRLVEPNYYGRFEAVPEAAPPNDPEFAKQWWLTTVDVLGLWPIGQGYGIKVAVVDSGVSLTHPDLAGNLESDGYDFGDNDPDPDDALGHGTAVAGIIAALANNGVGIAGLAPAVRLLPLKVSVAGTDLFTHDTVARAVDYAVAKGVRVINLSLTFSQPTELLRQSIQSALDGGIAVIVAAGNNAGAVAFPANLPGVIAVAATDRDGALYATSNRGPEVAIAAPGADIISTALAGGYATHSGTSFAAPMVVGAMAALMSVNASLPAVTLASQLQSTATPVAGQPFGQLQVARAAVSLLPAIKLGAGAGTSQRSFEADYRLPPFGSSVDLYVALTTPTGEFSLLPDCTWADVAVAGYRPFVRGYRSTASASGVLFGAGGVCAAIPLVGLPVGTYNWRAAAINADSGSIIGTVNSETVELQ